MPRAVLTPELITFLALSLCVVVILSAAVGAALSLILSNKWGELQSYFGHKKPGLHYPNEAPGRKISVSM